MKIKPYKIIGIVFSLLLILGLSLNSTLTNFFALQGQSNEDLKFFNSPDLHLSSNITWTTNGIIICNETYYQEVPQICSDGYEGAIIAWEDRRSGQYSDIYAQRIDSDGNALWDPNGTVICSASFGQVRVQLCSDGLGGAIITWDDSRGPTYDIYAQRIDSAGNVNWTLDGEEICTEVEDQREVQICSDGVGGAIITWEDYRDIARQIMAQRIDQNGNILWDANGTLIRARGGHPQIINNGMGAAIITCAETDIWAQKIALNGTVLWGADGIDICDEDNTQTFPHLCSDGFGGAIITWGDDRTGIGSDVYAQRVASNGTVLWILNGSAICTEIGSQHNARICSDDSGGAIITWTDTRAGAGDYDIYAQKIDSAGNVKWTLNGSAICTAYESQFEPQLCHDGYGGSIIVWRDYRNGNDRDVYAQWVDTDGNVELMGGMLICNATDDQLYPQICSDGSGGAFITWDDHRFSHSDVYAQHFITPEREEDGNGEPPGISFGLFYVFFIIIAMISLVFISKRRSLFKSK